MIEMPKNVYRVKYILSYDVLGDEWDDALDLGREALCITIETLGIKDPEEIIYVFNEYNLSKIGDLSEEELKRLGYKPDIKVLREPLK